MFAAKTLTNLLGITATMLLLSQTCIGQVKIDEDQTYTDGGYQRRVNYACESSMLHAECEEGKVISFLRGNYGRADAGTCYHDFNAGWNCRSNVSEQILRERCDQKRSCSVEASNEIFGDPCIRNLKYLDIQYYCVPGESKPEDPTLVGTEAKAYERRIIYACESTILHAKCEEGKVIRFVQARYGRSNAPTCHQDETWYCNANTSDQMLRDRCDAKRSCSVEVTNELFGDPCPYNLKYLEMQYLCVTEPTTRKPTKTTSTTTTALATTSKIPSTTLKATPSPTSASTKSSAVTSTSECDELDLKCLNFECPEGTGNFALPTNKQMFVFCMNWKARADTCGEELVFIEQYMTCFSENSLIYLWLISERKN